jgi:acetylornithine/N-succinyldiaminopimelate aminotransferase
MRGCLHSENGTLPLITSLNTPIPAIAKAPALATQELLARYTVPNYGRLSLAPARGQGVWLYDETGRQYLDFGGGVAVCSLGHCHPVITEALRTQAETLVHCSNWYQIRGQGELGQFLVEKVMRESGKCFFCNSGAEANEGLLKLARKFGHLTPKADGTPRAGIITFTNSFHGRTFGGISATGQDKVKQGFEPLLTGFTHLPYNDIAALAAAVNDDTVAILLEPVQGEGGVNIATPEFLHACERLCREHNALLMFDEVQSGLGRCGSWRGWGLIAPDVVPDAVSWAKGIAGGFPFGAAWIRERAIKPGADLLLCDVLGPGSHGTTFGGNPLGCAVALAVLREVEAQNLCARSAEVGQRIVEEVKSWQHPLVVTARGAGLLTGIELNTDALAARGAWSADKAPASIHMAKALLDAGLLVIAAGPSVVRLLPPLNVTDEEVGTALAIFRRVLDAAG